MTLDREKLLWVELGLEYALNDIHGEIGRCPDVRLYAEDIAEYQSQIEHLSNLLLDVRQELYPV